MRIFVTGATGFIGFAIVKELVAAGHQVTGLARSAASGQKLIAAGARVHIGAIEDLAGLRRAAGAADGAIHTGFYHKISHMSFATQLGVFLGGAPTNIVGRFLTAAVATDRRALQAIGEALAGTDRPLVAPFATMAMPAGRVAVEHDAYDPDFFAVQRAETEHVLQRLAASGVRTSAIRLPPSVHGAGDQGFVPMLIKTARKHKESAYVDDGANRWPAVHRLDAARLFRLALEHGAAGGTYHGVAEEGVPFAQIAAVIGRGLHVPVASLSTAQARKRFSFLSPFVERDNPTSSAWTQAQLGWTPIQPGLLSDLARPDYSKTESWF